MTLIETANAMDKIVNPGEYWRGTEVGSLSQFPRPTPIDMTEYERASTANKHLMLYNQVKVYEQYLSQEKKAWERMGELVTELYAAISRLQQETIS